MKALPLLKLLLMIALVAFLQILAAPAQAEEAAPVENKPAKALAAVPETSSVVLIGALGLVLMLRRRRLHA